ncbi:MAG: hypothetical protein JWN76_2263 [Chitinophagaceae bacterium]|nr:hypothetical protein [Chitinophagaceae bacterium]
MVASREQLKAIGAGNIYDEKDARAFTNAQRKNLVGRFKTVPPRVLFVPSNYVKTSNRGEYYILKDKFWYWKKSDGYFYLDETYYN